MEITSDTLIQLCQHPSFNHPCLLVSANNKHSHSQYSLFTANPTKKKVFYSRKKLKSFLHNLPYQSTTHRYFKEGWLGYIAYDQLDNLPLAEFYYYPWSICIDHAHKKWHLHGKTMYQWRALITYPFMKSGPFSAQLKPVISQQDYINQFYKVQEHLKIGDAYQVNLAQPFTGSYQGNPASLLATLFKALQPSFGGYFHSDFRTLISVSPERLLSINDETIETKPIKGTAPRGKTAQEDQQYAQTLMRSEKNRAENIMIVDLLRNDLARSSIAGSVHVSQLCQLEHLPNVHHLVSTIQAKKMPDLSPGDVLFNAFPGGSITGAPKIRVMEIIKTLEARPRGIYCGSFGYFDSSGNCDFNILIRSIEFYNQTVTCWAGSGLTIDSDPVEEYNECLNKISIILECLQQNSRPLKQKKFKD